MLCTDLRSWSVVLGTDHIMSFWVPCGRWPFVADHIFVCYLSYSLNPSMFLLEVSLFPLHLPIPFSSSPASIQLLPLPIPFSSSILRLLPAPLLVCWPWDTIRLPSVPVCLQVASAVCAEFWNKSSEVCRVLKWIQWGVQSFEKFGVRRTEFWKHFVVGAKNCHVPGFEMILQGCAEFWNDFVELCRVLKWFGYSVQSIERVCVIFWWLSADPKQTRWVWLCAE